TVRPITLSHRSQEVLSLMISRGCHSALYGCLMHNFLPEVSHGALARVHVLCWHSGCRALGVLRARGSPRSNSIVFYLDSSLMVQGLWAPGASVGQQLWLEEPPFLDSLEVNELGGGVCESALKLLHKSEGLQVYARVRTLLGKSDRSGSQGGLRKRGCCARRSSIPTRQRKRLTYRLVKREFALDDETLADLKDELIYAQKLAVEEDERVLVWIGDTEGTQKVSSPPAQTSQQSALQETQPPHAPPPEPR